MYRRRLWGAVDGPKGIWMAPQGQPYLEGPDNTPGPPAQTLSLYVRVY